MNDYVHKLGVSVDGTEDVKKLGVEVHNLTEEAKKLGTETKKSSDMSIGSLGSFKKELRGVKTDVLNLGAALKNMSAEELNSDAGRKLAEEFEAAKKVYAEMVDYQADLNAEIKAMASDTASFDALAEGAKILSGVISTSASVMGYFCDNTEDAVRMMNLAKAAESALSTAITVGNALQKQSALMVGLRTLQQKLGTAATKLGTAAEVKNTTAVGANTAATVTNTTATKAATLAQKAFNVVANANPYVLLATAVAGVAVALYSWTKATKDQTDAEKRLKEATEKSKEAQSQYTSELASSYAKLMTKYTVLQLQYNQLNNESERIKWINEHKTALDELGGSINSVNDAEKFFNEGTDAVVESFRKRAEASALVGLMEKLYTQQIESTMDSQIDALDTKIAEASKTLNDHIKQLSVEYSRPTAMGGGGFIRNTVLENQIEEEKKQLKKLQDQRTKLLDPEERLKTVKARLSNMDLNSLYPTGSTPTTTTKTPKTPKEKAEKETPEETFKKEVEIAKRRYEITQDELQLNKDLKAATEKYNTALFNSLEMTTDMWDKNSTALKAYIDYIKAAEDAEKKAEEERKKREKLEETKKKVTKEFTEGVTEIFTPKKKSPTEGLDSDFLSENPHIATLAEQYDELAKAIKKAKDAAREGGFEIPGMSEAEDKLRSIGNVITQSADSWAENRKRTEKTAESTALAADNMMALGDVMSEIGGKGAAAKAGLILQAVGSLVAGYASASASPSVTSTGWGWLAFALSGAATLAATISQIQKFEGGGFIKGSSLHGDRTPILANAGELVLNTRQQGRLWNLLNGTATLHSNGGKVEFVIAGTTLRGVLKNTDSRLARL